MTVHAPPFSPDLLAYLRQISEPEHPILAQIRAHTEAHRLGKMAIAPEQAALLAWLARLMRVENYLEIGTFTGYSSTAIALALPEHARLTCCDINVTHTAIARQYWQRAGIAHKITLHLQPAIITLDELIAQGKADRYDMIFIDADKPPTPHYYERSLKLVRSGGISRRIGQFAAGRAHHPTHQRTQPPLRQAILQTFNASLPRDNRIIPLTLPLGDGLTLLLKNS